MVLIIAHDLRPVRIVGCDFKDLMKYIEPGYTVLSSNHISIVLAFVINVTTKQ